MPPPALPSDKDKINGEKHKPTTSTTSGAWWLTTKYIIIMACSGGAFLFILIAVIYVYCKLSDTRRTREVVYVTSNEYGDHEMRRSRTEDFPPPPMSLYEEDSATESRRDSKTENDILMAQIRDKINVENARRTSPTRDGTSPTGDVEAVLMMDAIETRQASEA